jgi:hypothetical protein
MHFSETRNMVYKTMYIRSNAIKAFYEKLLENLPSNLCFLIILSKFGINFLSLYRCVTLEIHEFSNFEGFHSQTPSMTTNSIHLEYPFLSKCKTKRRILLFSQ